MMQFDNVYDDAKRAEAYAKLEFPGTYYLAYRDLPEIISEHIRGRKALDFGCSTGRSTRFLQKLGFNATGVDIADDMIKKATEIDPKGEYRLVKDEDLSQFKNDTYDLFHFVAFLFLSLTEYCSIFMSDSSITSIIFISLPSDFPRASISGSRGNSSAAVKR